jgi:hypothetical protein
MRKEKPRATEPVVAGQSAATLTREELAGAIRTLVAMAACWERRDPATTATDAVQAERLRKIVNLLREAADAQSESAQAILATLMRDELAVAMGAPTEQVVDVEETQGPGAGEPFHVSMTVDVKIPPLPSSVRVLGFRQVLRERRTKAGRLPNTLWNEANHNVTDPVEGDPLASAVRRCHWTVEWMLATGAPALDPDAAVQIANRIRQQHEGAKQGVIAAASSALYLFHARDRLEDGSAVKVVEKTLHNKISRFLADERHQDRPGLNSDTVDTGRFFGARNTVRKPITHNCDVAPIDASAAAVVGDAFGFEGHATEQLFTLIHSAGYPGALTTASRGAGFRAGESGIDAVLRVLAADSRRRGKQRGVAD